MKKLLLTIIIAAITVSVTHIIHAQGLPALGPTVAKDAAQQHLAGPSSAGYNPFRITEDEIKSGGIEYLGEGVYRFALTDGDSNLITRDFGQMLVEFRHFHSNLEQESMVATRMYMVGTRQDIKITAYYVTFHEKK